MKQFTVLVVLAAGGTPGVVADSPHSAEKSAASIGATIFRDIARRQNPAVVSIMARSHVRAWRSDEEEVFRMFGMPPPDPGERIQRVLGSGFVINTAGEILTNHHVVDGADTIEVTLFGNDRRRYHAVLIGSDAMTDSALLKLDDPPADLQPVSLGDSHAIEPGDWVMAIGDPYQLGHTVTVGFVSFKGRPFPMPDGGWQDVIQTDAAIHPGNSGGPLINLKGEVIGMNLAMVDDGGSVGIGFAIPIDSVKAVLPHLRRGRVVRGEIGAQFHEGPILEDEALQLGLPTAAGALVMMVEHASAAERAGLRAGDVILEFAGGPVTDAHDLIARVFSTPPGSNVRLRIFRGGAEHTRNVTVDEMQVETAEPAAAMATDDLSGLTLDDLTESAARRFSIPPGVEGAVVGAVENDSAADEARLGAGDVIRAINGRRVRTAGEATRELNTIGRRTPIFLLVWRQETEILLMMRKD